MVTWPRADSDDLDGITQGLPHDDDEWACELLHQLAHVVAPDRRALATWRVVHAADAWAALRQG